MRNVTNVHCEVHLQKREVQCFAKFYCSKFSFGQKFRWKGRIVLFPYYSSTDLTAAWFMCTTVVESRSTQKWVYTACCVEYFALWGGAGLASLRAPLSQYVSWPIMSWPYHSPIATSWIFSFLNLFQACFSVNMVWTQCPTELQPLSCKA